MKILIGCEFSGVVRDAFRKRGHDAWSCDLLPCDANPKYHIQDDILEVLKSKGRWYYDLGIFHPPCTYILNSGVRWLYQGGSRKNKLDIHRIKNLIEGAEFFKKLFNSNIHRICIENPVMTDYAKELIGCGNQTQKIQPWQFGHGETKATCLWLKNLPPLKPTKIVSGRKPRVHYESPGDDRWKRRSITYTGIAKAMAAQWGCG